MVLKKPGFLHEYVVAGIERLGGVEPFGRWE
jgi:hypothetical protein